MFCKKLGFYLNDQSMRGTKVVSCVRVTGWVLIYWENSVRPMWAPHYNLTFIFHGHGVQCYKCQVLILFIFFLSTITLPITSLPTGERAFAWIERKTNIPNYCFIHTQWNCIIICISTWNKRPDHDFYLSILMEEWSIKLGSISLPQKSRVAYILNTLCTRFFSLFPTKH